MFGGRSINYTYDGNGNLSSKTTGTVIVSYAYDAFNRIVDTVTSQHGTPDSAPDVATSTYDANGNLTSQTDGAGHITLYCYCTLLNF